MIVLQCCRYMSTVQQCCVFGVNYKGRPFMQGLSENMPLLYHSVLRTVAYRVHLITTIVYDACVKRNHLLRAHVELSSHAPVAGWLPPNWTLTQSGLLIPNQTCRTQVTLTLRQVPVCCTSHRYSLGLCASLALACATEILPPFNRYLQLEPFPVGQPALAG